MTKSVGKLRLELRFWELWTFSSLMIEITLAIGGMSYVVTKQPIPLLFISGLLCFFVIFIISAYRFLSTYSDLNKKIP